MFRTIVELGLLISLYCGGGFYLLKIAHNKVLMTLADRMERGFSPFSDLNEKLFCKHYNGSTTLTKIEGCK